MPGTTLVRIRFIQLARNVKSLHLYVLLPLAAALALACFAAVSYRTPSHALYASGIIVLACFSIHLSRKDLDFVHLHLPRPRGELWYEYAVFTFPFTFSSLLTPNWYCFPAILFLLGLITGIRPGIKQRTAFPRISSLIAPTDFELIGGFRKNWLLFMALYGAALAFCWLQVFPLLALWMVTTIFISSFNEYETLAMLRAYTINSGELLFRKISRTSRYVLLLFTPVLLINAWLHPGFWLIHALFLALQISIVSFAICMKYASYYPSGNGGNSIITALVSLGGLLPFFLPVPLLLVFIYFSRAKENLNRYLDDCH